MDLDLSMMSKSSIYHTLTQVIIPRPVAWVLSEHENGQLNLAPFSYFTPVSSEPPLVMISVGYKPDGSPKDTCVNITERENFVIHIAGPELADAVTQTSAILPAGESEILANELKTTEFDGFSLPRVIGPKVALGCKLYKIEQIGAGNQNLIFGEVQQIWIDDSAVETSQEGRINISAQKVDPIARLGGNEYTTVGRVLDIPRPS